MVIGYSFGDDHINREIVNSISNHDLKLFIVDPDSVDVKKKIRNDAAAVGLRLDGAIVGASSRSLRETFGQDHLEHSKFMRFLQERT